MFKGSLTRGLWEKMLRRPLLPMALIMTYILFHKMAMSGKLDKFLKRDGLKPVSCKSAMVMLSRRIPKSWDAKCEENNIVIHSNLNPELIKSNDKLKVIMYRELANQLIFVARHSPSDNLEHVEIVKIELHSPELTLQVAMRGNQAVKLATIPTNELLALHLQKHARVVEIK